MSGNLYEQTKEVAVLRSIGFTKTRIKLLYFYEAMVLIFASCLCGIAIGILVGFSMTAQETLLLNLSLQFYFPWE